MTPDDRTTLPSGITPKTSFITVPSVDLRTPVNMGTQALFGQRFDLFERDGETAHGALYSIIAGVDRVDYIGHIKANALSDEPQTPTHKVSAICATVFERADIKSPLISSLPRNAQMQGEVDGEFLHVPGLGFIHLRHLREVGSFDMRRFDHVAADMLGLPYVWGGTGDIGVDCSGLLQSALAATGVDAPRDADQQEALLGEVVEYADRRAGDLLFWPGHIGIVTDADQLLHANAHHMCVALEPVAEAVARIGSVRSVKRL